MQSDAVGFNFGYTVFVCKICPIDFKSEEARDKHIQLNHERKKIFKVNFQEIIIRKCKACSKEFSSQVGFDDHMKELHKGEKFVKTTESNENSKETQLQGE